MRDQDELPYIVIERQSSGLGAFFLGTAIGVIAGLLLAPRSGSETKEEFRRRVERVRDRAESARESVHRTRERLEDRIDSVREQLGEVREKVESGLDRVRRTQTETSPAQGDGRRSRGRAGEHEPAEFGDVAEDTSAGSADLG